MEEKWENRREHVGLRVTVQGEKSELTLMHAAKLIFLGFMEPRPGQHGARNYSGTEYGVKSMFRRVKEKELYFQNH